MPGFSLRRWSTAGAVLAICLGATRVGAGSDPAQETLQVAVAANFATCLRAIETVWLETGGAPLNHIVGSTGRHYAQIHNGAPFDLFFAADSERPRRLVEEELALADSRMTYAVGQLVLWSPQRTADPSAEAIDVLKDSRYHHLAIANPRLAPYGRAAKQALESMDLWAVVADRLVTGQSVGQAWQFVASGAAEVGLVAASQVVAMDDPGLVVFLAANCYEPIRQQAVLLKRAEKSAAARDFLAFVQGPQARHILEAHGYLVPEGLAP